MAAVTIFTDFGAPKYKVCHCLQFPIYLLEKEMATHCSVLAWRIPWRGSLAGYGPWGRKKSDRTEQLSTHIWALNSPILGRRLLPLRSPASQSQASAGPLEAPQDLPALEDECCCQSLCWGTTEMAHPCRTPTPTWVGF